MRITVPHYFDFGTDRELVGEDLVRPEAWDALRTQTEGPFALPATRAAWERVADERPEIRDRARAIDRLAEQRGARRIASYGVGGASLECWLHRFSPARELIVTEYAPATVGRLAQVFPEADVRRHDLFVDPPAEADLHLFHRIDTEFSNAQWRQIFQSFREVPVLLVASEVATRERILAVLRALPGHRRRKATRAGVIRNAAAFESLWRKTHTGRRVRTGDLWAWELEPR
jgi:hypothetical protein